MLKNVGLSHKRNRYYSLRTKFDTTHEWSPLGIGSLALKIFPILKDEKTSLMSKLLQYRLRRWHIPLCVAMENVPM